MTNLYAPFTAPKMKIRWGERRAQELSKIIAAFVSRNPYMAVQQTDGSFQITQVEPWPDEVPLVLGDAVHNLRTALDLLAGDLVRLAGLSSKGVYFPFSESAETLDAQIKNKNFTRAGADAVALLKEIKPYRGGEDLLRALHDLDVQDKHQLILPLIHVPRVERLSIRGAHGGIDLQGAEVSGNVRFSAGSNSIITHSDIQPRIIFGNLAPLALSGRPVLETLQQMAKLARGVVEVFEAASRPKAPLFPVINYCKINL